MSIENQNGQQPVVEKKIRRSLSLRKRIQRTLRRATDNPWNIFFAGAGALGIFNGLSPVNASETNTDSNSPALSTTPGAELHGDTALLSDSQVTTRDFPRLTVADFRSTPRERSVLVTDAERARSLFILREAGLLGPAGDLTPHIDQSQTTEISTTPIDDGGLVDLPTEAEARAAGTNLATMLLDFTPVDENGNPVEDTGELQVGVLENGDRYIPFRILETDYIHVDSQTNTQVTYPEGTAFFLYESGNPNEFTIENFQPEEGRTMAIGVYNPETGRITLSSDETQTFTVPEDLQPSLPTGRQIVIFEHVRTDTTTTESSTTTQSGETSTPVASTSITGLVIENAQEDGMSPTTHQVLRTQIVETVPPTAEIQPSPPPEPTVIDERLFVPQVEQANPLRGANVMTLTVAEFANMQVDASNPNHATLDFRFLTDNGGLAILRTQVRMGVVMRDGFVSTQALASRLQVDGNYFFHFATLQGTNVTPQALYELCGGVISDAECADFFSPLTENSSPLDANSLQQRIEDAEDGEVIDLNNGSGLLLYQVNPQ